PPATCARPRAAARRDVVAHVLGLLVSGMPSAMSHEGELPLAARERAAADILPVVGANLRKLRTRRGWSLERLARASGVSRAMLGQIELEQSAPSINVLWRIATALGVQFSALLGSDVSTPTAV